MDNMCFIKVGLVSIIMPAYNNEQYINESISSVIVQTYTNWELIVIDDASDDNTLSLVKRFTDKRIKIISNPINKGVSATRNIGIKAACGQYIAFLDSDDVWLSEKLTQQISVFKLDGNAVCCHSSYSRINEKGKLLSNVRCIKKIGLQLMRKGNFIGNLTGIIDRERVGTILQKQIKHEDYVMWLDVLSKKNNTYSIGVTEVLAKYRVSNTSLSSNKLQSISWHWSVLRKEQGLGACSASYYLFHYIYYAIKKRQ